MGIVYVAVLVVVGRKVNNEATTPGRGTGEKGTEESSPIGTADETNGTKGRMV